MNLYHVLMTMDWIYRSRWGRTAAAAMLVAASYAAGSMMNGSTSVRAEEPRYVGGATVVVVEPRGTAAPAPTAPFVIDAAPLGAAPSRPIIPPSQTISEL